jgi:hypothetical protein
VPSLTAIRPRPRRPRPQAIVATALIAAPLAASAAPSATIDFTAPGYTAAPSSPAGQNGWIQARADSDISLVDTDGFPAAALPVGGRALQFSNTTTPSGGADLLAPNIDPAGEPHTGATSNTFEVSFTVASATGAVQPGLGVDVAIDGASRYGGVLNLRHTPDGLSIGSYWVPEEATGADLAQWRSAVFAVVPATEPHVIRMVDVFLEGQPDLVEVYVDGVLVSTGSGVTTWEYYNRLAAPGGDESADTISFKRSSSAPTADGIGYQAGLPAAPAAADLGFLFTGISYGVLTSSPPLPDAPPAVPAQPDPAPDAPVTLSASGVPVSGGTLDFTAEGFLPYENVFAALYPGGEFRGWFQADGTGRVSGSLRIAAGSFTAGPVILQLTGAVSQLTAASTFAVVAADPDAAPGPSRRELAAPGTDPRAVLIGAAAGGMAMLVVRRRRSRAVAHAMRRD